MNLNPRQPEYFRKSFGELSNRQRLYLILHLSFGLPVVVLIVGAPWIGLYQLFTGDAFTGGLTFIVGVLLYASIALLNRV